MMSLLRIAIAATMLSCAAGPGLAHDHGAAAKSGTAPKGGCEGAELACAQTANPSFDAQGRLWMIWTAQAKVWVAHQDVPGGALGAAVAVTPEQVRLDGGPDSRPKLAIDAAGRVAVAFAVLPEGSWNGQIFTSRSADGGKTFTAPVRLDAKSPGHRFEAMLFLPDGRLLAAAIDKTNAVRAKQAGRKYAGASLSLSWSGDGGAAFSAPAVAVDQTCECCRLGVALTPRGEAVIAFRNVFDGTTRDHGLVTVALDGTAGPVQRVSVDNWVTDACPHQGPALAVAATGVRHVVWYTAGQARKGVFYARSAGDGAAFSAPVAIGRMGAQVSRPQVLAAGGGVHLAWKEFDGETTAIAVQSSADDGLSWSGRAVVATTKARADHPQLVADPRGGVFVSWLTEGEGHRLLAVRQIP